MHLCTWVRHSCHGYAWCSWAFDLDFIGYHFLSSIIMFKVQSRLTHGSHSACVIFFWLRVSDEFTTDVNRHLPYHTTVVATNLFATATLNGLRVVAHTARHCGKDCLLPAHGYSQISFQSLEKVKTTCNKSDPAGSWRGCWCGCWCPHALPLVCTSSVSHTAGGCSLVDMTSLLRALARLHSHVI